MLDNKKIVNENTNIKNRRKLEFGRLYKYLSQNKVAKTNMLLELCKGEKHTYIIF